MNLAIREEDGWTAWKGIPDFDVKGLVEYRLYDENANAQQVEIHTWRDGNAPERFIEVFNSEDIEVEMR